MVFKRRFLKCTCSRSQIHSEATRRLPSQPLRVSAPDRDLTSLRCSKSGHSPEGWTERPVYKPFSTRLILKGIGMRTMSLSLDFFDFLEEFAIYPVTTLPLQVIQTLIMWTTAVCLRQWVFTQSKTDLWSWGAQLPKRMRRTQGSQASPRSGPSVYSMTRTRQPSVNGDSVNSGVGAGGRACTRNRNQQKMELLLNGQWLTLAPTRPKQGLNVTGPCSERWLLPCTTSLFMSANWSWTLGRAKSKLSVGERTAR